MSADLAAEVEAARSTLASLCVDANALVELSSPNAVNHARGFASGLQTVQVTLDHVSEHLAAQPVAVEKPAKTADDKPTAKEKAAAKAKADAKKAKAEEKEDEPAVKVEKPEPYTPPGASRYGAEGTSGSSPGGSGFNTSGGYRP